MRKICSKCKLEKSIQEFGKSSQNKDGLKYSCKLCRNAENTLYRKTHKIRCYIPATGIIKKCSMCKEKKAIEDFGKNCCFKDGRNYQCISCSKIYGRKIEKINKEKFSSIPDKTLEFGTKICSKCKKEKMLNEFYRRNGRKIGVTSWCKTCWSKKRKNQWRKDEKYKNKLSNYNRQYNISHVRETSQYNAKYSQNSSNKKNRAKRVARRKKTDIHFMIKSRLIASLYSYIKRQGGIKSDHTMVLTGCSIEFLKKYIENQFTDNMNWNNYGRKGWSIDHIKPCASFDLTKPEEQRICFHYTNLRPLWEIDNIKKSSWYNGKLYRKNS